MEQYAKTHKSTGVVAFAQFQSMTGQQKFIRAINRTGWCARLCSNKHAYKYLKGKWLSVKKGPEPTVINWSNLHIGPVSRGLRTLVVALITVLLLAVSIMGIVTSKYYQDETSEQFDVSKCGGISYTLTKDIALEDEAKPPNRKVGLMNCYCYEQFLTMGLEVAEIDFTTRNGTNKRFCNDWLTGYSLTNAIVQSTAILIIVLNTVIVTILKCKFSMQFSN